ncbi:DNA polymerase III subunit gamma and tau [Glaciihabitans sp. dw_435]|uniref:DNA polymerase III subunit gamma and tau n=1 Tax=Glaciihabitans sp. dw_435 TaxID=2720081 RepID=UPI001BD419FF|nr:DNA polymerase III subunit gamma and tau [Glaciihabitans sp. dw_435]
MVTALYRRYRPETFAELIGQSQVTDPLRTALRTDRVNHAYLFSGPRGCGKTTSARILARCLNCAEGPTDTPCGVCPSCVELSRDGGGSLDVVEIDAASHNGVDDARDIRERAVFAPARDRYKIFILDEAHMVTPQGFNALLKIVEEPPEHVKFIFATTEPEKVIGTIRSRTHHYPFRLVPPAQMLDYTQQLCEAENITVAPGVLPLVVRAGGGSVRDTLSLLDQLMAGSEGRNIEYERAVALLGYTHGALLDEVVDAVGARDAAAAFSSVDRVIQTGQDPRRFVEDLLERLRDLIIVAATGDGAAAVLRGIPADELERMTQQARKFGTAELSRAADVVNAALTEMTGATSPRLHLELMIARVLVPSSDETDRGALARVERLERRIGVDGPVGISSSAPSGERAARPSLNAPVEPVRERRPSLNAPVASGQTVADARAGRASLDAPRTEAPSAPAAVTPPTPAATPAAAPASGGWAVAPIGNGPAVDEPEETPLPRTPAAEPISSIPSHTETAPVAPVADAATAAPVAAPAIPGSEASTATPATPVPVSLQQMRDSWPEILELVKKTKRSSWMVIFPAEARALQGDVLTLTFPNENDVANFKQPPVDGESVSEHVRRAILDVLGIRVKFVARVETTMASPNSAPVIAPGGAGVAPAAAVPTTPAPAASAPAGPAPVASAPAAAPTTASAAPVTSASAPASATVSAPAPTRAPVAAPAPVQTVLTGPPAARTAAPASAPQQPRRTGTIPDTEAPPDAEEYVEPMEPDLEPPADLRLSPRGAAPSRPAQQAAPTTAPPSGRPTGAPRAQQAPPSGRPTGAPRAGAPVQAAPTQTAPTQTAPAQTAPVPASAPAQAQRPTQPSEPSTAPATDASGWAVAPIPGAGLPPSEPLITRNQPPVQAPPRPNAQVARPAEPREPEPVRRQLPPPTAPGEKARYGESVVREILSATFIEEQPHIPRVIPRND